MSLSDFHTSKSANRRRLKTDAKTARKVERDNIRAGLPTVRANKGFSVKGGGRKGSLASSHKSSDKEKERIQRSWRVKNGTAPLWKGGGD
jgi:hypothetical protein